MGALAPCALNLAPRSSLQRVRKLHTRSHGALPWQRLRAAARLAAASGAARAAGRTREQLRQDPPLQLRAAPLLRVGRARPRRHCPPQLLEERMERRVRAAALPAVPRARAWLRLRLCLPHPARRVAARGRQRGRSLAACSVFREPAPFAGLAPALLAEHRLAYAGGGCLLRLLPTPVPACPTAHSLLRP